MLLHAAHPELNDPDRRFRFCCFAAAVSLLLLLLLLQSVSTDRTPQCSIADADGDADNMLMILLLLMILIWNYEDRRSTVDRSFHYYYCCCCCCCQQREKNRISAPLKKRVDARVFHKLVGSGDSQACCSWDQSIVKLVGLIGHSQACGTGRFVMK